jgi:hypothetical protein
MIVALVLAIVATLVGGAALLVSMQARNDARAGARRAEALVQERSAALAALLDRRVATLAAQGAGGLERGSSADPGQEPLYAYVEARLSQVSSDLEALVADLLRNHARSIRQDALAAAAQAVTEARPR